MRYLIPLLAVFLAVPCVAVDPPPSFEQQGLASVEGDAKALKKDEKPGPATTASRTPGEVTDQSGTLVTRGEGAVVSAVEETAKTVKAGVIPQVFAGAGGNVGGAGRKTAEPCPVCDETSRAAAAQDADTAVVAPEAYVAGLEARSGGQWTPNDTADLGAAASKLDAAGDSGRAAALIHAAYARHPEDKSLKSLDEMEQKRATTFSDKSLKDRAAQLMAMMRGDAGTEPPPGAQVASSPALASALAFPSLGGAAAIAGPRSLSPAALAALGNKDQGLRRADPLVRNAVSKMMVQDMPAAEILLSRRLEQNPSDEPALRYRALARRQMGRFEPSAHDAKGALGLAPWDVKAHRILIDDEVSLGHPEQALEEANHAMQDAPNSAELFLARADVYKSMGNRDAQLADLKEAAALDAAFDTIYQHELAGPATAASSKRPHSFTVWMGAVGTALIFFSFVLFRKRGDSSVRLAMRQDDHALLSRGARPDAAPAGFKIVKTLGQGGMGVVYEAVDLGLQRTVALKKLRSEIADSPRERARFLKEARTVAGLKHPNIVEIHAIHEDAEGLFLVFEKVGGETLHERLGRGPLSPADAVGYLRQIAKALDCAHSAGVVHQDLKPANVMVSGDTAKVMDFGIARRVQETMSTLSRVEVAGTPAYMAPEQERGGSVGPAADIFALGACSYELLTGRTPFPHGGMMMKAEKMYRPASEVNPGLSAAADNAISRALEPDPAARWPTASSFVEALARSLS